MSAVDYSGPQDPRGILTGRGTWEDAIEEKRQVLSDLLHGYLGRSRWFGGKARRIEHIDISETIRFDFVQKTAYIFFIEVAYRDDRRETYILPLTFDSGKKADRMRKESPSPVLAEVRSNGSGEGVLYDALWDGSFTRELLNLILGRRQISSEHGVLEASITDSREADLISAEEIPEPGVSRAEQSNTSVLFGKRLILKWFRRLESGLNPDLEIGRFLAKNALFSNVPGTVGALEYRKPGQEPSTIAVLQQFVENKGDAWQHTVDYLNHYYERALARSHGVRERPALPGKFVTLVKEDAPLALIDLFGAYLLQSELLGKRTGELHLALAADSPDPAFMPEPFSDAFKQTEYESIRSLVSIVFRNARQRQDGIPKRSAPLLEHILSLEPEIVKRFQLLLDRKIDSLRIRIHGDYHLGQVLYTGRDFVIIDFEGEPARSLAERKSKKSPLRDVAGMIRSFHYASYASMFEQQGRAGLDQAAMEPWRELWYRWNGLFFLSRYLKTCQEASFMSGDLDEIELLLSVYLLEKAIYELGYELNNRPDWVRIPLEGIREIMGFPDTYL